MNKKLVIGCIGMVLMLVTITMVSAASNKPVEKKESPLFKIRVQNTLEVKKQIFKGKMNNFFVNLLGNRIFLYVPFNEKPADDTPYVLSRGSPCSVKCPLTNEADSEINWTERQPVCK